jgi:hypothetical protein
MEPGDSLPHSQKPATGLCPEPDQTSPRAPFNIWRYILILSSHICLSIIYQIQLGWSYPEENLYGNLQPRDRWSVHTVFKLGSLKGKTNTWEIRKDGNIILILIWKQNLHIVRKQNVNVGAKMKWLKIRIQWWALVHMSINIQGTKNSRICWLDTRLSAFLDISGSVTLKLLKTMKGNEKEEA